MSSPDQGFQGAKNNRTWESLLKDQFYLKDARKKHLMDIVLPPSKIMQIKKERKKQQEINKTNDNVPLEMIVFVFSALFTRKAHYIHFSSGNSYSYLHIPASKKVTCTVSQALRCGDRCQFHLRRLPFIKVRFIWPTFWCALFYNQRPTCS